MVTQCMCGTFVTINFGTAFNRGILSMISVLSGVPDGTRLCFGVQKCFGGGTVCVEYGKRRPTSWLSSGSTQLSALMVGLKFEA